MPSAANPLHGFRIEIDPNVTAEQQNKAAGPHQRSDDHPSRDTIAEEKACVHGVIDRGERENHRDEPGGHVCHGGVEADEVEAEQTERLSDQKRLMAECWRLKSAGRDQRDDQHERGYAEAVEYRNEDRDRPNLHRKRDPGRSPDDDGPEEENEGVQG